MYPTRQLNYWFGLAGQSRYSSKHKYHGPKTACMIMTNGSEIDLDITNQNHAELVRQTDPELILGVAMLAPADNMWHGDFYNEQTGRSQYNIPHTATKAECIALIKQIKQQAEAEEAAILADPAKRLERLLKHRDWTAHMSDDFRYWAGAEAEDRLLGELLKQVDPVVSRRLWTQYAEKNMKFPLDK